MPGPQNLDVSVENLGPIKQGGVELKPLTVFIGPNNSGKSYMALLVYALIKALSGGVDPLSHLPSHLLSGVNYFDKYEKKLTEAFRVALRSRTGKEKTSWVFQDLPEEAQKLLHEGLERMFSSFGPDLEAAMRDYFACENLKELVHVEEPSATLAISLNDRSGPPPFLSFRLEVDHEHGEIDHKFPDITHLPVYPDERGRVLRALGLSLSPAMRFFPITWARWQFSWAGLLQQIGIPLGNAYYLPGARSGILQGYQVLASLAIQTVRRGLGLQRMEMAPFSGVAADFLQLLLERFASRIRVSMERRSRMGPALKVLEEEILSGEVSVEEKRPERPVMLYTSGSIQLPLLRASSMVGELAPLELWIKHLLDPGDFLVIDEPEAHLHPGNQRLVAKVMVRLVRAGVRVLCTTHSSIIIHQLSNHLLASEGDPKAVKAVKFTKDDLLKPDEVNVYLFDMGADGTHVKPVPIEPGWGISEEEFVRIQEAIGEQTYRLSKPRENE